MDFTKNFDFAIPEIQYDLAIHYYDVKKASGIAYIILVLINESINKNDYFGEKLVSIGVPTHVHHIFAHEIEQLLFKNVLSCSDTMLNQTFEENKFSEYLIKDFELTDKGKQLLIEGVLPTGQEKTKRVSILYEPWHNKLCFSTQNMALKLSLDKIEYFSSLNENFFSKYEPNSDIINEQVSEFVNARMSQHPIELRNKEIIFDINFEAKSISYFSSNLELVFDTRNEKKCKINFVDTNLEKFILGLYSLDEIFESLRIINNFNIDILDTIQNEVNENSANLFSTIPDDQITKIALNIKDFNRKSNITLVSEELDNFSFSLMKQSRISVQIDDFARIIPGLCEIRVNNIDEIYGYVLLNEQYDITTNITNDKIQRRIRMAYEVKLKYADIKFIFEKFLNHLLDYSDENFIDKLFELTSVIADYELLTNYVSIWNNNSSVKMNDLEFLCNSIEKLNNLQIKDKLKEFIISDLWPQAFSQSLEIIKNDDDIKDNIVYMSEKFINIGKILHLSMTDILRDVINVSDKTGESTIVQYYYFIKLGYTEKNVLELINPLNKNFICNPQSRNQKTSLDSLATMLLEIKRFKQKLGLDSESYVITNSVFNLQKDDISFYQSVIAKLKNHSKWIQDFVPLDKKLIDDITNSSNVIINQVENFISSKNKSKKQKTR